MSEENVVNFRAATVYARKIQVSPKVVMLSGAHRGSMAACDNGYLIIEQEWFPVKKKKKN